MIASKKEEELLLEANNAIEDLNEIIDPDNSQFKLFWHKQVKQLHLLVNS